MIRLLALTLMGLIAANPALALSCLKPSIERTFAEAQQAEASYIVALGTLVFDENALPRTDHENPDITPSETRIPASFIGKSLTHAGFSQDFVSPVTLLVQCFGPWCARLASGTEQLAFLRRDGQDYELAITPCGGFAFAQPSPEQVQAVKRCFRGARCQVADF